MKGDQLAHMMPGAAEGHIVGWRIWYVDQDGVLGSIVVRVSWPDREPITSRYGNYRLGILTPHIGVFGFKNQRSAHLMDEAAVPCTIGEVALWGRIAEHRHGYRAQYAYPLSLRLKAGFEPMIEKAASLYGLRLLKPRARSRLDRLQMKAKQADLMARKYLLRAAPGPHVTPLFDDIPEFLQSGSQRAAAFAPPRNNS